MTEPQREACLLLACGRISESELFAAFGRDFSTAPNDTIQILQQARDDRSADDVEFALGLIFRFRPTSDYVPLLCELLVADFHTRHEDIIFSGLWLPYRKMYRVTLIFFGVFLLEKRAWW